MVEPAIRLSALQPRIRLTSLLMEALINLRELLSKALQREGLQISQVEGKSLAHISIRDHTNSDKYILQIALSVTDAASM